MFALGMVNQVLGSVTPMMDFFVIVGQSNAEGRGDASLSPASPNGIYVNSSGDITPLADPVGGASPLGGATIGGSMWPTFSNEWWDLTGNLTAFIERATGGTALIPNQAGSNWSPSGTLRSATVTAVQTAITALEAYPGYTLRNVYFLWCQGESDAQAINGTTITGAIYKQALKDLATYFKAQIPQMVEMGVIQSGRYSTNGQAAAWAEIRQAQEDACAESSLLRMIYRGSASFLTNGMMVDTVHWNQYGLNKAALAAAIELNSSTPTAIPSAPTILATQNAPTPDTTAVASRTVSHTTHADTKTLIVTLHSARLATNTTFTITGVTFNGVAMREVWEQNSANASPACRVNMAHYILDEIMYGGPLGNVTGDIVCTHSNTANVSDMCFIDLAEDVIPESHALATASSGTTTTGLITTNGPALIITGTACVSATIDIPTTVITGATELMDHGLATTKGGSFAVAHETVTSASVDKPLAVTWSHACSTMNQLSIGYRQKVAGE